MPYPLKVMLSLVVGWLFWAGGFLLFYVYVNYISPPGLCQKADGIVVLTGGRGRIQAGLQLLKMDCGKKLFISGVSSEKKNVITPQDNFSKIIFDYVAQDTVGNAQETFRWAKANQYKILIIVTSNYHLPRSLMEFQAVAPQIKWLPYPVIIKNKECFYLIFQEYNKFIYSFFRIKMAAFF